MFNYRIETARFAALTPYVTIALRDGQHWRIGFRQKLVLPPGDTRRQRLQLEGLPASALWWDAEGIRNAQGQWHWQPEQAGQTAPWLETVHRSWPYHPPLWLLDSELVVLTADAFAADRERRQYQQRALLRFWVERRTPLLYLAGDGRDAWHMQRLIQHTR